MRLFLADGGERAVAGAEHGGVGQGEGLFAIGAGFVDEAPDAVRVRFPAHHFHGIVFELQAEEPFRIINKAIFPALRAP